MLKNDNLFPETLERCFVTQRHKLTAKTHGNIKGISQNAKQAVFKRTERLLSQLVIFLRGTFLIRVVRTIWGSLQVA